MSLRTLLKMPRFGLFYFESDKTISVIPLCKVNRVLKGDNKTAGSIVELYYGEVLLKAEIIAVGDDETKLHEKEVEFLCDKKNAHLFSSDEEDLSRPKKKRKLIASTDGGKNKRKVAKEKKRSEEKEKKSKKVVDKKKPEAVVVARFTPPSSTSSDPVTKPHLTSRSAVPVSQASPTAPAISLDKPIITSSLKPPSLAPSIPAPSSPTQASPAPSSPVLRNLVPSSPEPPNHEPSSPLLSYLQPSSPVLSSPASLSSTQPTGNKLMSSDKSPDNAAQEVCQVPKHNQAKTVDTPTTRPVRQQTSSRMPSITRTAPHHHLSTPIGQLARAISPGFRNRALNDPSIARNLFAEKTRGHGELSPQVWSFLKRIEGQLEYLTCVVEQTEERMKTIEGQQEYVAGAVKFLQASSVPNSEPVPHWRSSGQDQSPHLATALLADHSALEEPSLDTVAFQEEGTPSQDVMPEVEPSGETLLLIRAQASSSKNFAVKLLRKMFKTCELRGRNICGVRGKEPVDPVRVAKIKQYIQRFYPGSPYEQENIWRDCRKAMDSFLRKIPQEK